MSQTHPRPTRDWRALAGRGEAPAAELARLVDHTILKAQATPADVVKLCEEAAAYGFGAVCVNSVQAPVAAATLERLGQGGQVEVCAVVGFPLGAMITEAKAFEAEWVVRHGATEVDMVISVGHLKAGDERFVEADIRAVVLAAKRAAGSQAPAGRGTAPAKNVSVKVIIEACYLTDDEKVRACELAVAAGADFVKTSTGFGSSGATVADVALMRRTVGEDLGVKAAGGIRDLETALAMVAAGADRLGLSAGVTVIEEARAVEAARAAGRSRA